MDTTETYIKMSDCDEVQREHMIGDNDYVIVSDGSQELYSGLLGFHKYPFHSPVSVEVIWLPRQDELQEMLTEYDWRVNFVRFKLFTSEFDHEEVTLTNLKVESNIAHYTSMEQLWLAFVMRELHRKIWNGTEWVKSC